MGPKDQESPGSSVARALEGPYFPLKDFSLILFACLQQEVCEAAARLGIVRPKLNSLPRYLKSFS